MKNIYKYIACAFALTAALSCSKLNETPVFEDSKSFVAFGQTSYSVNEDAGTISIPVTVASPDPKQVTVAYSVADGTAKVGTNFSLADESAVLVYDGETRVQNIVINIKNIATTAEQSGYTGDLVFTVTLDSAGELELGYNKTCTVKIVDLDHPLAEILGTYSCAGVSYFDGPLSWTATFQKDDEDENVVWITAVTASCPYAVYGNVTDYASGDWTITIPAGQSALGSYKFSLCWFDGDYFDDSTGNIVLTRQADGSYVAEQGIGVYAYDKSSGEGLGFWDLFNPGITYVK